MIIHREGYRFLFAAFLVMSVFLAAIWHPLGNVTLFWILCAAVVCLFLFLLAFFRVPHRLISAAPGQILCPADGKVVVIENVFESEYLHKNCIQVSIFMSPLNVHANWAPISGEIEMYRYHPGKYLLAWHPKSSIKNERTTMVFNTGNHKILMRQIAGFLARRIVCYAHAGHKFEQGDQVGFIKFGSRIDLFLPPETEIDLQIGQDVTALHTVVGRINTHSSSHSTL